MAILDEFIGSMSLPLCVGVFLLLSFGVCFYFIYSNYRNAILSIAVESEYRQIYEKYRHDKSVASGKAIGFLKRNRYMFLGDIFETAAKCFAGVCFAYGMAGEISSRGLETNFPFTETLYQMLVKNYSIAFSLLFIALMACVMHYYGFSTITNVSLVETSTAIFVEMICIALLCVFVPAGFILFMDIFNMAECLLILLNVNTLRARNVKRLEPSIRHFDFDSKDTNEPKRKKSKRGRN